MEKQKKFGIFPIKTKSVDVENATLTAIVSTEDEDRHGDVVDTNAWDLKNYKNNPVILNSHNHFDATEVIGKALKTRKTKEGLEQTIQFAVNENPKARVIFELYAGEFLRTFSVGFLVKKFAENKKGEVDYNHITEAELLEVSAVSVPANAFALAKAKGIEVDILQKDDTVPSDGGSDNGAPEEEPAPATVNEQEGDEKIMKKTLGDGILCCYCNTDITKEEHQHKLEIEENVFELVCEACFNEKSKPAETNVPEKALETRKGKVARVLNKMSLERVEHYEKAGAAINSILEGYNESPAESSFDKKTQEQVRTRKTNQAIRFLLKAK